MATNTAESGTPEAVALRLFELIVASERKAGADRKWILDTYAQCIRVVRNHGGSSDPEEPAGKRARDVVAERLAEYSDRIPEGNAHPSDPSES
jgi:hypothetical protein